MPPAALGVDTASHLMPPTSHSRGSGVEQPNSPASTGRSMADSFQTKGARSGDNSSSAGIVGGDGGQRSFLHKCGLSADVVICPALDWIDSWAMDMTVAAVIVLNFFALACEADFDSWSWWFVIHNIFQVLFTLEVSLRLCHRGLHWFAKDRWWAVLDTVLCSIGMVDFWIQPLWCLLTGKSDCQHASKLRILRLLRLLRLNRVFSMVPRLPNFLEVMAAMLGTFTMIFAVLFTFIFASSIVMTEVLDDTGDWKVRRQFTNVVTSFFTLFQVTTIDNWEEIATPIIEHDEATSSLWRCFFVLYIAFASWTMISTLTAVASDSMIAATTDQKESELKELESKQKLFVDFLRDTFHEADADGNGLLDKAEFREMIRMDVVLRRMRELGVDMSQEELENVFDTLDIDQSGELSIDEFVTGLSYFQEGLSTKHVVNIDYSLRRITHRIEQRMNNLSAEVHEVFRQNKEILILQKSHEELREKQRMTLQLFKEWANIHDPALLLADDDGGQSTSAPVSPVSEIN